MVIVTSMSRWRYVVLVACGITMCIVSLIRVPATIPGNPITTNVDPEVFDLHDTAPHPLEAFTVKPQHFIGLQQDDVPVDIMLIITRTKERPELKNKLETCLRSILRHRSVVVRFRIVTDVQSSSDVSTIVRNVTLNNTGPTIQVFLYDVRDVAAPLGDLVEVLRRHFSYKPGAYYHDALFFLSVTLYKAFPALNRLIVLDVDTKLLEDIRHLYNEFDKFSQTAVLGAAYEQQPVYRHLFYQYRKSHPGTPVGSPRIFLAASRNKTSLSTIKQNFNDKSDENLKPSANSIGNGGSGKGSQKVGQEMTLSRNRPVDRDEAGRPGFNSGVLLLRLDKMRSSKLYQNALTNATIQSLAAKYHFRGHLGDQDFYTLMGMEYPDLVYPLPCGWNRQLCQWWRKHGYEDVFDQYNTCSDPVKLYHGNCNMPLPKDVFR